ncbi:GNAT family N-acetyltransferase [Schumannella soli]|uniref:GNAT family N-acetyltransferase n=1 Tax=Schumannella soli TaxID=2590779 RepID=A0A506Y7F7_9MICO|nr:GNAT family N-acetyltransferase [Schumannella soli]TPW78022.1 GNAT family N-acetyltransferase [Schumannella soli]
MSSGYGAADGAGFVSHDGVIHERLPDAGGGAVPLRWVVRWETQLDDAELARIHAFLVRVFPDHPGGVQAAWAGSRPELRLLGFADDADDSTEGELLAHIGIARRFIRARESGASVLVGDVGLVGVSPDRQGAGLGRRLMHQTDAVLADLGVDFGTLTTGDSKIPFYEAVGWHLASNRLHAIDLWNRRETFDGPFFIRPVRAPLSAWPTGDLERNAREI